MASSFASDRGKSGTACENPVENEQIYQEALLINQSESTPTNTLRKNVALTVFFSVLSCSVQAVLQPQHGSRHAWRDYELTVK